MKKLLSIKKLTVFFVLFLFISVSLSATTIRFVDFSWDSVLVHNRIAGYIVEHAYGYDVEYGFFQTIPGLLGVRRGDYDVSMEFWVDNIRESYMEALEDGDIVDLGSNFQDAPQGWYVPTYVIKGDPERGIEPMAPDLKSVTDLEKYWKLFKDPEQPNKGRFYNGPVGWVVHDINLEKLETYGLNDKFTSFDPGSQASLATAIMSAYKKGDPILAYYWEPTWIMGKLDMTKLEEPEFDEEIWNKNSGCEFPPSKVHVAVSTKMIDKAPELLTFFANYSTTLDQTNNMLAYMQENNATAEETAIWFLNNYGFIWEEWFPAKNEELISKVIEALERE
ncbi:MAG: ABC transporter substrate-binding protein [Kosmotoga sp.]|nr:MAG: ABC transporter substrate-binding protein [Kosmotoga sp.]